MPCTSNIAVSDATTRLVEGTSRVSVIADGSEAWFETSDTVLKPSGEAFGTAFLIPALHNDARPIIDAPTDRLWLSNVENLINTIADWWELPTCLPTGPAIDRRNQAAGIGLCFTGGVDSFFSLLRSGIDIDTLVHVQGFDIPLTDTDRLASAEHDVRTIADALGLRCVIVKTNLREHPLYLPVSWERTHGGALMAVAHLLRGSLGRMVLSSSAHKSAIRAWGSDRRIDRCWSSSVLAVTHTGEDWRRYHKLIQIANHPLVRDHLRVCWEHRSEAPNCSQCEKCLRTMTTLNNEGLLEAVPRFDNGPIAERIDQVTSEIGEATRLEYAYMIEEEADEQIAQALRNLLARSPAPSPLP